MEAAGIAATLFEAVVVVSSTSTSRHTKIDAIKTASALAERTLSSS